jgi:hypothetical protein
MNVHTPGLFADRLPAAKPTLRSLAADAVIANQTLNQPSLPDAHWDAADTAAMEAREQFLARFTAETGIDAGLIQMLCNEGIFV